MRDEIQKKFERMDEAGGRPFAHGGQPGAFYDGDRVRVSQSAEKVKRELRGKAGTVVKWHHDDVYTVDIDGREYVLKAGEMELSEKKLNESDAEVIGRSMAQLVEDVDEQIEDAETLSGTIYGSGEELEGMGAEFHRQDMSKAGLMMADAADKLDDVLTILHKAKDAIKKIR